MQVWVCHFGKQSTLAKNLPYYQQIKYRITMFKKDKAKEEQPEKQTVEQEVVETPDVASPEEEVAEETPETEEPAEEVDEKDAKLAELTERCADLADKNLRMMAEFDNFRRRTAKEKIELQKTAGERIFVDMLPLVDDFERAKAAMQQTEDIESLRQGIELIYNKFITFLEKNDVKQIDTTDADFDTDFHEAITQFPAPTPEQKGKVIDCTQKGYTLGDKVIRYAKVVVGE